MLALIKHLLNVALSVIRERGKVITRPSKWKSVKKAALKANPKCAACGSTVLLQVHHFLPVASHPKLELDPKNLVVMCMSKNECYLSIGQGGSFRKYNPYLSADLKNIASGLLNIKDAKKIAKKSAIFSNVKLPLFIKRNP
jgi:hypothetical protein